MSGCIRSVVRVSVLLLCLDAAAHAAGLEKVKAAAAAHVGKDDIDLWAFSAVNGLAPGRTAADFRAMPNLARETRDELRGTTQDNAPDAAKPRLGPVGLRFVYAGGLDVRVLDYGENAFVTRLRVSGEGQAVKDAVKIGSPRAQVEAVLGRPSRGGGGYAVYEGKTDEVRVFYTPAGALSAVEITRGG